MEKINWNKALGFGALIWLIMFAVVSGFVGFNLYDSIVSKIFFVVVAAALSYLFAMNVKPASIGKAFVYGFSWVIVGVVLDLLISMQFNPSMFGAWEYWLSYILIILMPALDASLHPSQHVNIVQAH